MSFLGDLAMATAESGTAVNNFGSAIQGAQNTAYTKSRLDRQEQQKSDQIRREALSRFAMATFTDQTIQYNTAIAQGDTFTALSTLDEMRSNFTIKETDPFDLQMAKRDAGQTMGLAAQFTAAGYQTFSKTPFFYKKEIMKDGKHTGTWETVNTGMTTMEAFKNVQRKAPGMEHLAEAFYWNMDEEKRETFMKQSGWRDVTGDYKGLSPLETQRAVGAYNEQIKVQDKMQGNWQALSDLTGLPIEMFKQLNMNEMFYGNGDINVAKAKQFARMNRSQKTLNKLPIAGKGNELAYVDANIYELAKDNPNLLKAAERESTTFSSDPNLVQVLNFASNAPNHAQNLLETAENADGSGMFAPDLYRNAKILSNSKKFPSQFTEAEIMPGFKEAWEDDGATQADRLRMTLLMSGNTIKQQQALLKETEEFSVQVLVEAKATVARMMNGQERAGDLKRVEDISAQLNRHEEDLADGEKKLQAITGAPSSRSEDIGPPTKKERPFVMGFYSEVDDFNDSVKEAKDYLRSQGKIDEGTKGSRIVGALENFSKGMEGLRKIHGMTSLSHSYLVPKPPTPPPTMEELKATAAIGHALYAPVRPVVEGIANLPLERKLEIIAMTNPITAPLVPVYEAGKVIGKWWNTQDPRISVKEGQ